MSNVTLSFPNLSEMAYFIIECHVSDFVADWKNASLTGNIEDRHVSTAFLYYNAYVIREEAIIER